MKGDLGASENVEDATNGRERELGRMERWAQSNPGAAAGDFDEARSLIEVNGRCQIGDRARSGDVRLDISSQRRKFKVPLPCGPLAPNPAELLHSEKFLKLLDELSDKYDRVLLDSPPIGVVTDAAILSKVSDGTVFVVQANSTPKEAIRRSARQLYDVGASVLGVILNDFEIGSKGRGGYSDYYYYQYYRGYGDDADDAQVKA